MRKRENVQRDRDLMVGTCNLPPCLPSLFPLVVFFWSTNLIMHAWLGNFVSEIPRGRPMVARAFVREHALPEMLHFRDSREIMYEVPLFPLPFHRSLSISTSHFSSDSLAGNFVLWCTIRPSDEKAAWKRGRSEQSGQQSSENESRMLDDTGIPSKSVSLFVERR